MSITTTPRQDRTDLDERDEQILLERVGRRAHINGPRVGDFVIRTTGEVLRFTHDHGDRLQVSVKEQSGSFYFDASGYLDYSGSLDPAIKKSNLHVLPELREGACWFFHHNQPRAHNGVAALIPCRVYEEVGL